MKRTQKNFPKFTEEKSEFELDEDQEFLNNSDSDIYEDEQNIDIQGYSEDEEYECDSQGKPNKIMNIMRRTMSNTDTGRISLIIIPSKKTQTNYSPEIIQ